MLSDRVARRIRREIRIRFFNRLCETHKVFLGEAAEMCGIPKRTFIEVLGRRIPVFDYSPDESWEEIRG